MQLVVSCLLLALVTADTLPMAMVWDDVLPPYLLPILVREAIIMKDFPNYVRTPLLPTAVTFQLCKNSSAAVALLLFSFVAFYPRTAVLSSLRTDRHPSA